MIGARPAEAAVVEARPATARPRVRFWLRLALFTLPFALGFVVFSGGLIYTGESMPLAEVVRLQMGDAPVLYRPRFGARDLTFKTLATNMRRPEIVAVGSSHVLQMRSLFFDRRARAFYNAGAPAWLLDQVEQYLHGLAPDAAPRILIFGLDDPWFNDAYVGDALTPDANDFETIFAVNRSVLQTVIGGESIDVGRMLARREPAHGGLALGLRAIRDGHGFRNDGSEQYGDFLVAHFLWPQNERQRHLDLLRDGKDMYVRGDTVSTRAMAQLERILAYCKERGILVVGFSPPFMPTLYQRLEADGQHTYVDKLIPSLNALFARYGDRYFDFSDGAQLGATDDDFFDGWHASERIYLRLYMRMLEQMPARLGPYSDMAYLQKADAGAKDTFDVFGNRVVP